MVDNLRMYHCHEIEAPQNDRRARADMNRIPFCRNHLALQARGPSRNKVLNSQTLRQLRLAQNSGSRCTRARERDLGKNANRNESENSMIPVNKHFFLVLSLTIRATNQQWRTHRLVACRLSCGTRSQNWSLFATAISNSCTPPVTTSLARHAVRCAAKLPPYFWNANKFAESNACCYSDFGGIRSYRRSQRIGVLFTMLGKDIVSCFQKLECRLGDRPFQIYGIETGRAKIAEAKRAGKTDACDANLGLQRLCIQPILEVLHDIGLELEAVPGDGMGPWHFVMIENPATSGKTPVCTNVTTRSL